jgi:hypothetical protein
MLLQGFPGDNVFVRACGRGASLQLSGGAATTVCCVLRRITDFGGGFAYDGAVPLSCFL